MAYQTTTELVQLAEKELGHDTSGASSQRNALLDQMDIAHQTILSGGGILNYDENNKPIRENAIFDWALAATPKILTLRAPITSITATATRNSNAITFSAAPDSTNSIAGWYIQIANEEVVYQINAHTGSATTATLDGPFIGSANASAATCKIFKLQYSLGSSDVLRLVSPLRLLSRFSDQREIAVVDREELLRQYPLQEVDQGTPELACIVRENEGTFTLQFSHYPDDYVRVEADYIAVPSTLDTTSVDPIVPKRYRTIISYLAAYFLGMRNNDNRAGQFLSMARTKFMELVDANYVNYKSADLNYGMLKPRSIGRGKALVRTQVPYIKSN